MAKGKKIGLYLGVNSVGAAAAQRKEILSVANFELSSLDESKVESLNEDIRWEALINKTLREVGADVKDIHIALADRDFIFRQLQIPQMSKKEIETSLLYEIEKYIPFKLDELEWDYDYFRIPKERKLALSFLGIRESSLLRIRDILSRLNMKEVVIEPSCLSLVRVLKTSKDFSKVNNFALLDFTTSETYLTFFQNNLPIFNRYIGVTGENISQDASKFIEAVNFSFQYFRREYKTYQLEKFIIIGEIEDENLVSSLKESLHIDAEVLSPKEITGQINASVESAKAIGVAGRDHYPYRFKPVFKKAEIPEEKKEEIQAVTPPLRVGLMTALLAIGALVTGFLGMSKANEISIKKFAITNEEKSILLPPKFEGLSWGERKELTLIKQQEVKDFKKLMSFSKLSGFFRRLERNILLPEGMWIERLSTSQSMGVTCQMQGVIYREDVYSEKEGINDFIYNLGKDESVTSIFEDIQLERVERAKMRDFEVSKFSVSLRKAKGIR